MNGKKELLDKLKEVNKNQTDIDWAALDFKDPFLVTRNAEDILEYLNYEYDEGFGSQELDGVVVFKDSSWLERSEYDGAEEWVYCRIPKIEDYME